MFKAALKTTAGVAGILLVCAALLALFATVTNEEAAAHLDRIPAHQMSGIAPGQIYAFVDGEPFGAPVCRLRDLSDILVEDPKGDIEFRNTLGRMVPFVAKLYDSLVPDDGDSEQDLVADNFHTIRWHDVVDLYIPFEDLQTGIFIHPECESTVAHLVANGGTVCIVQRVMHHASRRTAVYAYGWRQDCIGYCKSECADDGSPSIMAPPVSIWSRMKFGLGLITSETFVLDIGTDEGVTAILTE